ncbi:AraC-like DNA-binding protein [Rhizomicrobium palustre]|uniref:AraC-like DNA-binding protein n=1 Tax=Rhizomicrobium palustre TaxID=189966 RepID=A0A846N4U7_9PROT|nr:helix-turn-helix domain-containing protein [Rhizomicrobium palustre]NIK90505.1 AraC-like DNA-binding protein [Rhizomicrobium palustre]
MKETFRIGSWSMLLLVLAFELLALAILLLRSSENKRANRLLAAALCVTAGMLTPFVIGYAGAYDVWPWLSFAPFAIPLALGPCLYGYVTALAEDRPIARRHWIVPALQFFQLAAVFPWPVATKTWFDGAVQEPYLNPLTSFGVLVSMAGYALASARRLRRYEGWLKGRRRDPSPARLLRAPVVALGLLVAARAGYDLWDELVAPVTYFDLFAYYIALGVLGLWIGLDGWRGAHRPRPVIEEAQERNWAAEGRVWIARLQAEDWWREEGLDLEGLARRLATNTTSLSRGLNAAEGGFTAILARLRAEAVAARIRGGDDRDLLVLALEAGFGSKASFNRAFKARFGVTPSEYRVANGTSAPLPGELRRPQP